MRKQSFIAIISSLILLSFAMPISAQNAQQQLLTRINNLRAELGLSPYSLNSALNAAATNHAQWMVSTSQVTHIQDNGSSPSSRAQASGYNSQWVSENIYMGGLASVDTAWTFWINSSIHYAGLTSANFQDIGIATAQGTGGRAYVLVFGVPSGASSVNTTSGGGNNNNASAPAAPPLAIVGYDAVGNIQYELQAGDTLGQVLLLFGYTWDDLIEMLDLNDLTEADITNLAVGQVILVPPPQGTYTPTPIAEVTAEITEPAIEPIAEVTESSANPTDIIVEASATALPNIQTDGIIPTPVPENDLVQAIVPSSAPLEAVGQPATFIAITPSPTLTQTTTSIPTLQVNNTQATAIAQVPTTIPEIIVEDLPASPNNPMPPLWLVGAIILQLGIFGYATFEGVRRFRKK